MREHAIGCATVLSGPVLLLALAFLAAQILNSCGIL